MLVETLILAATATHQLSLATPIEKENDFG
jgi:hypothetical protein